MLRVALTGIAVVVLAGCNSAELSGVDTSTTPAPEESPTPAPTATPQACQFYGIDASSTLWVIDPVAITAEVVGETGVEAITDIAITTDNRIIAITEELGYELDPASGEATVIADEPWLVDQNALDALPNGRLLVGGEDELVSVDPDGGNKSYEGTMGGGRVFSGDIATVSNGLALATAKVPNGNGENDHLYRFDLDSNSSTDEGDLGFPRVFGLDVGCDGALYGMVATSPPQLLLVDPTSAQTLVLGTMEGGPSTLWGAAGPAEGN